VLEDRLAIWDQAEASLLFASGMAAISTTLWAYARPGSVIVDRKSPIQVHCEPDSYAHLDGVEGLTQVD
jgi:cystathionine beta-lyase/cystathionine gamma-synthase